MQQSLFNESTPPLRLEVKGPIPNFKNSKRWITKLPNGKPLKRPLLITDPNVQKIMRDIERAFELQLLSASQTAGGGTLTAHGKRLLIASSVPADDCWTQMPEVIIRAELCEPGQEGATIVIKRIN